MAGRSDRILGATAVTLAVSWGVFALAGDGIARWIAGRAGNLLLRVSGGKFDDPAVFLHGRMRESLVLASVALSLCLMGMLVNRFLKRKPDWQHARGLLMGATGFILLNVFGWFAGQTVAFWSVFFDKAHVDNFAQFQIKRALLPEVAGKKRALLIGNSQANRSIDEVLMNQLIGDRLWTTELTQPGARGFDLLILTRDIATQPGDLVICYLSEISFYGAGSGIVASDFLHFSEIPDLVALHAWDRLAPGAIRSGLLGQVLPTYRFRNSVAQRVLGPKLAAINQLRNDTAREGDLTEQAKLSSASLRVGRTSEFAQAAFTRMTDELSDKGCTIILIDGHVHPALSRVMSPDIRENLTVFLKNIARKHPDNIAVVEGSRFFTPQDTDFTDLVHFNDRAQQHFTRELASYLESRMADD